MSAARSASAEAELAKDTAPAPRKGSVTSVEGSTAGSDLPDSESASSRPGSRADSRPGSRPGSAAGSVPSDATGKRTKTDGPAARSGVTPSGGASGGGDSTVDGAAEAAKTAAGGAGKAESVKASGGEEKAKAAKEKKSDVSRKEAEVEPMAEDEAQAAAEKEAEAMTVEKEEPEMLEDRSFTVIDVGSQSCDEDDEDKPEEGQKRSPMKKIRVISAATVCTLGDSDDEDDPVPVPTEDTNGDVTEVPARRTTPARLARDKSKKAGTDGDSTQTNGGGRSGGGDATETVTMVVEKTSDAAASQSTMYGVVSHIYKEPTTTASVLAGSKSLRPLAVRPGTGLAVSGGPAAVTPTAGGATTGGATANTGGATANTLLSSRQSKCVICNWVKPIKYMMMANGASSGNVICSDECLEKCVNNVKSGRMNILSDGSTVSVPAPVSAAPATTLTVASVTSLSAPADSSASTPAAAGAGAGAGTGAGTGTGTGTGSTRGRTVCQNAECGRPIPSTTAGRQLRTVWETMVFCSPACAVQHQKADGSACVFCKMELPEMVMGKYCVRFGSDVRQFCSNLCLDGFKKRLKVCSYCQRDITRFQGSFLAPVGNAGSHQFKEFCSQSCLTRYKTTHNELGKSQVTWAKCSVCLKNTPVEHRVAVKPDEPAKQLCSQICLKAYKFAIKDEGTLDTCAVCKALLVVNNMSQFRVWNGSAVAYLCSQSCSNVFVLSNRRIVSCRYCKVKKYNFDMMEVTAEKEGLYCSVHCLKNCGKRIGPRRDKKTVCAHCGGGVGSSAFSNKSGNANVFCSTKCAQASMQGSTTRGKSTDQPPASNGVASGVVPVQLPQIQSVISLADDDDSATTKTTGTTRTAAAAKTTDTTRPTGAAGAADAAKKTGDRASGLLPAARNHPSLVMMPPAPVSRRNVCIQVQPKKTEEKKEKETATISTQTDPMLSGQDRVLPVPVPMYVPAPMAMYNCPYPLPVPLVIPVPVPLLCGGEDALRLLCGLPTVHRTKQLEELSSGRPAPGKRRYSSGSASYSSPPPPEPDLSSGPASPDSGGEGAETAGSTDTASQPPPHKRRKAEDRAPEESGTPSPPSPSAAAREGDPVDLVSLLRAPPTAPQARPEDGAESGGDGTTLAGTEFIGPTDESHACHKSAVKYTWCVRVFEQFVRERNRRPPPPSDSDSAHSGTDSETQERLVADPLQATPSELAAGLRAMTRELKRPNGERYPPDLIHYILLGVQLYLLEHRRWDSLFWSESYAELATALEERLRTVTEHLQQAELDPQCRTLTTHVEEQQLWEAKVLGAHSPQSLLTTVVFFVTKHFHIGSLRWHQKLSFAMVQESITLKSRLQQSSLKLLDSRNVYKRSKTYEMPANTEDPFRCPVRFLEFYLSRCPESVRSSRTSPLYLTPAAAGRPDGSAWFSADPLPPATLQQLLSRLLTVRQLQTALLTDASS